MRDLLVVLTVVGSIPIIFVRPFAGILMWTWISLMNPHRLTWGYAYDMRVALVVAVPTLFAWLLSREPKRPPVTPVTYLLAAFTFWFTLANLFAILPDAAWIQWNRSIKIIAMTFVAMCLTQKRERIQLLVWVTALSIGFYGLRGGVFTILTGGHYRVWGPVGSFIADNNQLALALIMVMPLMRYLQLSQKQTWVRIGLWGLLAFTIIAVLGTYSRGGLAALLVMLAFLWLRSRHRMITGALIGVVLVAGLALAPARWYHRMDTIRDYQQDASFEGRVNAWTFAWRLALDRPLVGGGMGVFYDAPTFLHYVPTARTNRAAHSIYFQILGESGFVGLGLFLALGIACFVTAQRIRVRTRDRPELRWARDLATMLQVSLVGYASGGALLNLGFYDLYYFLIAILVATGLVVDRQLTTDVQPTPASAEVVRALSSVQADHGFSPPQGT